MVQADYWLVNTYFISWYVMSAFLLVNIVFGAIINNYEIVYNEEMGTTDDGEIDDPLLEKIEALEAKIDRLIEQPDKNS